MTSPSHVDAIILNLRRIQQSRAAGDMLRRSFSFKRESQQYHQTEFNIFANEMVSEEHILDKLKHVKNNKAVVDLEFEDLITGPHHKFLPTIKGLINSNDRPWESILFIDSVQCSDLSWWQGLNQMVLKDYQGSLPSSFSKSNDQEEKATAKFTTQARVMIPTKTPAKMIAHHLKTILKDDNVQNVTFSGGLFGYSSTSLPEKLADLLDEEIGNSTGLILQAEITIHIECGVRASKHNHKKDPSKNDWQDLCERCIQVLKTGCFMTPLQSLISDEKQARKSAGAPTRRSKTLDSPSSSKAPKCGVQRSKTMDSVPGTARGVQRFKSSDMTSPSEGRAPRRRATSFTDGPTPSSHHRRAPRLPVRSGSGASMRSTDTTDASSRSSSAADRLAMLSGRKSNLTRHLNKSDSDKSMRSVSSAFSDLTESSASDVSQTSRRSALEKQSSVSELSRDSRGGRMPVRRHTAIDPRSMSKISSSHSHKERTHSSRKSSVDRMHKSLSDVGACPDYNWSQGIYVKQNAQLVQNHPAPKAA